MGGYIIYDGLKYQSSLVKGLAVVIGGTIIVAGLGSILLSLDSEKSSY
ncbi:MAG: hypothetical protein Q7R97_02115 [Candidatus Daviesbacteria bacterium]|nr:hypothetical protein [Candidatus Daviesbacteria bacterium]